MRKRLPKSRRSGASLGAAMLGRGPPEAEALPDAATRERAGLGGHVGAVAGSRSFRGWGWRRAGSTAIKTLFLAFISRFIQQREGGPASGRHCPAVAGLQARPWPAVRPCALLPGCRPGAAPGPARAGQRLSPAPGRRSTTRSRCRRCGGSARCPSGPRRCSATASAGCGAGGGPGCACTAWLPSPLGRREGSRRRRQKTRGEGNHTALLRWEHGPCVYTQDEKHLSGVL